VCVFGCVSICVSAGEYVCVCVCVCDSTRAGVVGCGTESTCACVCTRGDITAEIPSIESNHKHTRTRTHSHTLAHTQVDVVPPNYTLATYADAASPANLNAGSQGHCLRLAYGRVGGSDTGMIYGLCVVLVHMYIYLHIVSSVCGV
jgi:hypothetical protein